MTHPSFVVAILVAALMLVTHERVMADNYQDASKLFKQGELSAALSKVEAHLVAKPNDPQSRFLKGVILSEQQKPAEAIRIFSALTEDHPELPEPYNNLAVLYANQGLYDKARNALEMAIRTHPSYAVAHENLGDIYATMASQAYDKALKLDSANTTAKAKLSLIKEIFTPLPPARGAARIDPVATIAAPGKGAHVARREPDSKADPAPKKGSAEDGVTEVVHAWAKAWSSQDVNGYLSFYAADFNTPGGDSRAQWEATRRERITRPKRIEVTVSAMRVAIDADGNGASVSFRQSYRSDTLKSSGNKTLTLSNRDNRWLIVEEKVSD